MKFRNIFKYAARNMVKNKGSLIFVFMSILLLSVLIISMTNYTYFYWSNTDNNIIESCAAQPIVTTLKGNAENLVGSDLKEFLSIYDRLGYDYKYEIESEDAAFIFENTTNVLVPFDALIIGKQRYMGEPKLLYGEFAETENELNLIWLSNKIASKINIELLGSNINLKFAGQNYNFILRGIVDGEMSYINYYDSKKMMSINLYHNEPITNLSKMAEMSKLDKKYSIQTINSVTHLFSNTVYDVWKSQTNYKLLITLATVVMGLIALILCMASIISSVKMSVESNSYTLGIMKALGMKDGQIFVYILVQIAIVVILSSVFASIISLIIANPLCNIVISELFSIAFGGYDYSINVGFNPLTIFVNIAIVFSVSAISCAFTLAKFCKRNTASLLQGGKK